MLLETICYEFGHYPLLKWHQQRVDQTFEKLFGLKKEPHQLSELLPMPKGKQKRKVRFLYSQDEFSIEVHEHTNREVRSIQCVYDDHISYAHKYADRDKLKELYNFRGEADEMLVIKNGLVTDAYYYSPVFWDGSQWIAPRSYLLKGTRRQYLLDHGRIVEKTITVGGLVNFEKISLVNGLVDLEVCSIPISAVKL